MAEGSSGEKQHGNDRDADHEHGAEMRLEHQEHSETAVTNRIGRTVIFVCSMADPADPADQQRRARSRT